MRPLLLALLLLPSVAFAQQPQYEMILVPFDTMTLPTGSAMWRAELWVRNDGTSPVSLLPDCHQFGRPYPCTLRIEIPAGRTALLDVFERAPADFPGVLLYVPRDRRGDVTFNLRIRDLNRGADAIGTEIPVIREEQLRTGPTTLINVPLQPNGRVDLRLYAPDAGGSFTVRVYAEPTGHLLREDSFTLAYPPDSDFVSVVPVIIDASAIFRGWVVDRVRVEIDRTAPADAPYWPLLTITNQRNNQITVVSPQ